MTTTKQSKCDEYRVKAAKLDELVEFLQLPNHIVDTFILRRDSRYCLSMTLNKKDSSFHIHSTVE